MILEFQLGSLIILAHGLSEQYPSWTEGIVVGWFVVPGTYIWEDEKVEPGYSCSDCVIKVELCFTVHSGQDLVAVCVQTCRVRRWRRRMQKS